MDENELRGLEVRLWVEQKELALLPPGAAPAIRAHYTLEVQLLETKLINARLAGS